MRPASVPADRVRSLNEAPTHPERGYVLYWMTSARRSTWSFALDHALDLAEEMAKPLVILEALRVGYRWASDRIHRFVLQGMAENARRFATAPVTYYAYVEPTVDAGKGLLRALGADACAIVTDDFPSFMLSRMTAAAAAQLDARLEAVDGNGLLPLSATPHAFPTAYAFRRFLQRELAPHLERVPRARPFARRDLPRLAELPASITTRWPRASEALLSSSAALSGLPIDHSVPPVEALAGGSRAAEAALARFLREGLPRYEDRNDPSIEATSGLSPYLHFGQISAHQIFHAVMTAEDWSLDRVNPSVRGSREGFWGVSRPAEGFLDQLLSWRELGYNFAWHRPQDEGRFESLPDWSRRTLAAHAEDARSPRYGLAELEAAATYDELWNAAQRQLVLEGRIQNYLRMLWGKKVLEWAASPKQALEILLHLNNKYALDGRDPNSESGIFWIFGRYDRPWGPERPIFGTVRYMSSDNTRRKLDVKPYLARYGPRGLFDS